MSRGWNPPENAALRESISNRDNLVVENGVMLLALIVIALNFFVDIACAAIDPRLRAPAA